MRDNHNGCPELFDAYERDGLYFGAVRVTVAGEIAAFEFGVQKSGYLSLKRILQSRPFEHRGLYRYFFTGTFSKRESASETVKFCVRIEQGRNGKNYDFYGPVSLVANLRWFQSLENLESTTNLKRLS
ncbi:MAG TPA: hypothetical protein VFK06_04260 [Candidatus Angelobacter sp.]|nr:hypothetical protein [Candidatus Angelobacter sp.]